MQKYLICQILFLQKNKCKIIKYIIVYVVFFLVL